MNQTMGYIENGSFKGVKDQASALKGIDLNNLNDVAFKLVTTNVVLCGAQLTFYILFYFFSRTDPLLPPSSTI